MTKENQHFIDNRDFQDWLVGIRQIVRKDADVPKANFGHSNSRLLRDHLFSYLVDNKGYVVSYSALLKLLRSLGAADNLNNLRASCSQKK